MAIQEGLTLKEASQRFNVPKSTLDPRLKYGSPQKAGCKPKMTIEDENQLVSYVKFMANIGSPVSAKWVRETAAQIMKLM